MKTLIFILMLFGFIEIDKSGAEILAIKAAIQQETISFYGVDYPQWQRCWIHEPHAFWSYADSTGASYSSGWSSIDGFFQDYFKTQAKLSSGELKKSRKQSEFMIERDWQEIRLYGDAAYVRFVQRVYDETIERDETEQIRVLEKHEGKWLIAYVGALARYPSE